MNVHTNRRAGAILALGVCLAAVFAAGPAQADPSGAPTYRQLAGVGSDTTQGVMNAIANSVTIGGTKVLGSYDATGSATITTKDPATSPGCSGIARPNGSGAGRNALLASLQPGSATAGCIQFSRSSSLNVATSSPSLTYIPFATDAVTFAITSSSSVPRSLTLADLTAIYKCQIPGITPILPQAGSGTRSFWETTVGIADSDVNNGVYPCIVNGKDANNQVIEEHDGRVLNNSSVVPISVAQWVAQASGTLTDIRGRSVLGVINGTGPLLMNPNQAVTRSVYNVVPTSQVTDPTINQVFVGSGSLVCQSGTIIQQYGFAPTATCGDTTNHS
ncbi:substrate-binding domain-containing protein [Hamadaea tsunoensis]|uniref:substrate-binding domain-containing protein n=1 Tax=Hamadaea tsunoensis TaxID=53368 RepID=UPI0004214F94|nr:substrate-binding domain-containing protein [Hamadaea tsunoensis]